MRLVSGNGSTAARLAALRLLQRLGGSSPSATALMVVEPVQLADALVLLVLEAGAAPAAAQPKGKAAAADAAKSVSLPRVHCRVHTLSTVPPHERHALRVAGQQHRDCNVLGGLVSDFGACKLITVSSLQPMQV